MVVDAAFYVCGVCFMCFQAEIFEVVIYTASSAGRGSTGSCSRRMSGGVVFVFSVSFNG